MFDSQVTASARAGALFKSTSGDADTSGAPQPRLSLTSGGEMLKLKFLCRPHVSEYDQRLSDTASQVQYVALVDIA